MKMAAITHYCDRCGRPLANGTLRYVVKIQVYAATDPLEISLKDLQTNHTGQIEELIQACRSIPEEQLMSDVFEEFHYDLCRRCQQIYLSNPLPTEHGND